MKNTHTTLFRFCGWVLAGLAVCFLPPAVACTAQAAGCTLLEGDFIPPALVSFTTEGADLLSLVFSEEVTVTTGHAKTDPAEADMPDIADTRYTKNIDGNTAVQLKLEHRMQAGKTYTLCGEASDTHGNTLSFCLPVSGYNDRIPDMVLSEIRTQYGNGNCEFIEIYTLTGGNLAGLALYSAYDGEEKIYRFPAAEVKAKEYITVHFRSLSEGCTDETEGDLSKATAKGAVNGSRDLWVNNEKARIGDSDVILLYNTADNKIKDAVLYAESDQEAWKKQHIQEAARRAHESGIWPAGAGTAHAAVSDGHTVTRTLSRQNIANIQAAQMYNPQTMNGPNCWAITATGSASPGAENSDKIYVKK